MSNVAAAPAPDALFLSIQGALAGEYSLIRELGRGGMGVVYLAQEVRLAREVALKVLPPHLAELPELREQFVREAQMAARLSHPNIVPIHRVGESSEFVYFAMAYVPGGSLGDHLRTRGPLTPQHATRVLREVAWALTYAHAAGLVHRDVKPDNILLEAGTGRALVTDFGIARASMTADALGGSGKVVGTVQYMSPEQAMGEPVDARSDIYSLGIVSYYALSGRLPFDGGTPSEIMSRHLTEPPVPLRTIAPTVPHKLASAIDCALAKDAAQRFQRASEFAEALDTANEPVRDIPAPIRVWLSQEQRTRGPRIIGAIYGGMGATALGTQLTGGSMIGLAGFPLIAVPILLLPTLIATRRVLAAGYTLDDMREGLQRHWLRRREEMEFELTGRGGMLSVRTAGIIAGTSAAALVPAIPLIQQGMISPVLGVVLGGTAVASGVVAISRYVRGRMMKARTPLSMRLWAGKAGERMAKVAGWRLKNRAVVESLPQVTELALGRATDALFASLPKEARRQLEHLPATVRRLEGDATKLREQIAKLEGSISQLESDARMGGSRTLADARSRDEGTRLEYDTLRADLHRLREQSNEQLATTVAALENIRLGLLRLQLGSAQVESVTAVLDQAREAIDDIAALSDANAQVEAVLRRTNTAALTIPAVALALAAALGAPGSAGAQNATFAADIDRAAASVQQKVVGWRRDFHRNPELSWQEERTAGVVAAHLRALGLEVKTGVGGHGVVGVLRGGRPGGVVALRADMDALPVTEEVDLPFRSEVRTTANGQEVGVMHACGHDTHVAMLMGAAEVLAGMRDRIPGTVKFIFQPAEEASGGGAGGAARMIEEGVLGDPAPAAIFGLHVFPYAVGEIVYRPGGIMASSDGLRIVVRGRQTHGALPWAGVDPVVVSSQIVLGLQTIVSRQVELTRTPAIVTLATINGGVRNNIIPDSVVMTGTIRAFDADQQKLIHERIRRTAESIAKSAGAEASVTIELGNKVTFNDLALTARMRPTLERVAGKAGARVGDPTTTAEDFSRFQEKIPGVFVFLGVAPDPATAAPNHSPRFFADEGALPVGVRLLSSLAVDYLLSNAGSR